MNLALANLIVTCAGLYLAAGLCFAALFVVFGVAKIDPGAKQMPIRARLIILPGATLLWPLMLVKWFTQSEPPAA